MSHPSAPISILAGRSPPKPDTLQQTDHRRSRIISRRRGGPYVLALLHRWESAELNQEEAAELLGVSERTFRRWTRRYEDEGEAGLIDRRLGQASGKRVPVDRAEEVERLYRERYQGFTVKHFHEHRV